MRHTALLVALVVALAACGHRGGASPADGGNPSLGDGGGGGGGGGGDAGGSDAGQGLGSDGSDGSGSDSGPCGASVTCALALGSGLGAGTAVAVDSQRNVYVAGNLQGALTFGGHTFTPVGVADGFVASFTSDGAFRWARALAALPALTVLPQAIAIDANDDVYIAGQGGYVDFGGGVIVAGGGGFVASFAPDGTLRWATPDPSFAPLGIAAAGGHVYTTGLFTQTATWGTSTLPDTDAVYHGYVARFDPATGAAEWAHDLGECGWAQAIAANGAGVSVAVQQSDMTLLATFAPDGTAGASRVLSEIDGSADGLRLDAAGNLYMTGRKFGGDDRLSGAPMPAELDTDSFIAVFSASDGIGWSWTLVESPGSPQTVDQPVRSAWDADGNLVVAGDYTYSLYAGTVLGNTMPYGANLYLASFATTDTPLPAVNPAPTASSLIFADLAIDSAGTRWLTGFYQGAPDLGDGALPQTVETEEGFYLLRYAP